MGIRTEASIEIGAPPEKVFEWITDRAKVTQWAGVDPDAMPADASELKVGYRSKGTMQAPDGPRETDWEVTAFDPPREFATRTTYAGGDQSSSYRLSADGDGTKVEVASDTDYAKMAMPAEAAAQIAKLAGPIQKMIEKMIHSQSESIESGEWDQNSMVEKGMKDATEQMLGKLKAAVESA